MYNFIKSSHLSRVGAASSVNHSNVYIYGGLKNNSFSKKLICFNTIDKTFKIIDSSNHSKNNSTVIYHNNKLYVIMGGYGSSVDNSIIYFNFLNEKWYKFNIFAIPKREGHVSVIYENKLYIGFGSNNYKNLKDFWSLDLETFEIKQLGFQSDFELPNIEYLPFVLVKDNIYIITKKGIMLIYNITSSTWSKINISININFNIYKCACDYYNDHIYIWYNLQKTFKTKILRFNIKSQHFQKISYCKNIYVYECSPLINIVNGYIYIMMGGNENTHSNEIIYSKIDDTKMELRMKSSLYNILNNNQFIDLYIDY